SEMQNNFLDFTKKERLDSGTMIVQADNGTIFYYKYSAPQRLYVKWNGREMDATLPGVSYDVGAHGNAFYVRTNNEIYKAVFTPADGMKITLLRGKLEDEEVYSEGLCEIVQDGKRFVYRVGDDSEIDFIDVSDPELEGLDMIGIHRRKAIFLAKISDCRRSVLKFRENAIVVACKFQRIYCCESSPFLYVVGNGNLYTINTDTMEFLPDLAIEHTTAAQTCLRDPASRSRFFVQPDEIWTVNGVGVHDGVITLSGRKGNDFYEMTAQLPKDYFEDTSNEELRKMGERIKELEADETQWAVERADLRLRIVKMEEMLREGKVGAFQSTKPFLEFDRLEKLSKPLVCIQLENGSLLYFDNAKPFELYTIIRGNPQNADLSPIEGEFDCAFKGTIGNHAYFRSVRGKVVKFYRATIDNDTIILEQINAMKTTEISLFHNQPLYFLELSKEWSVYKYHENHYDVEGDKFDISEINHLSKYDRQYHRGVLYLFRENSSATVERVNENVVKVEGPLLDVASFYAPPHSSYIYILNCDRHIILIMNTANLAVTQINYEPPIESDNHSIVGIHDGILTMTFDGILGRHLSTT
ncbi:hypothetical protein PENTCL1PPCAC_8724, partial [Pristionchus entomophagus]